MLNLNVLIQLSYQICSVHVQHLALLTQPVLAHFRIFTTQTLFSIFSSFYMLQRPTSQGFIPDLRSTTCFGSPGPRP